MSSRLRKDDDVTRANPSVAREVTEPGPPPDAALDRALRDFAAPVVLDAMSKAAATVRMRHAGASRQITQPYGQALPAAQPVAGAGANAVPIVRVEPADDELPPVPVARLAPLVRRRAIAGVAVFAAVAAGIAWGAARLAHEPSASATDASAPSAEMRAAAASAEMPAAVAASAGASAEPPHLAPDATPIAPSMTAQHPPSGATAQESPAPARVPERFTPPPRPAPRAPSSRASGGDPPPPRTDVEPRPAAPGPPSSPIPVVKRTLEE